MGKKLNNWCKNIMLVCGTITSIVGAIGSIMGLIVKSTYKASVMRMPAPAPAISPNDAYLDGLGRGGPAIPIDNGIDWLAYMPEIFLVGVVLLGIGYYLMHRSSRKIKI